MLVIEEKSQVSKGLLERTGASALQQHLRTPPWLQLHTPQATLPRPGSPLRPYPELCQIELRGIVAQDGHQRRRPGLSDQTTAEGSGGRVHSLAVPGDVAGSQVDQHIIHVEGWPEHCLRKPLSYPSKSSFPLASSHALETVGLVNTRRANSRETSQGRPESRRTPRTPTRLPHQAPWQLQSLLGT